MSATEHPSTCADSHDAPQLKERLSQRKEKSMKIATEAGPNPLPGRCNFFVQRKMRHCRMVCLKDKQFCGEHMNETTTDGGRKRIPCPLDPKHTLFEEFLQSHLKKCNAKRLHEQSEQLKLHANLPKNTLGEQNNYEGLKLFQLSEQEMRDFIVRVRAAAEKHLLPLPSEILDNEVVRKEILSHGSHVRIKFLY